MIAVCCDDENSSKRVDFVKNENVFKDDNFDDSDRTSTVAFIIHDFVRKELKQKLFFASEKEKDGVDINADSLNGFTTTGGGKIVSKNSNMTELCVFLDDDRIIPFWQRLYSIPTSCFISLSALSYDALIVVVVVVSNQGGVLPCCNEGHFMAMLLDDAPSSSQGLETSLSSSPSLTPFTTEQSSPPSTAPSVNRKLRR